jgi:hypothetical protein
MFLGPINLQGCESQRPFGTHGLPDISKIPYDHRAKVFTLQTVYQ